MANLSGMPERRYSPARNRFRPSARVRAWIRLAFLILAMSAGLIAVFLAATFCLSVWSLSFALTP